MAMTSSALTHLKQLANCALGLQLQRHVSHQSSAPFVTAAQELYTSRLSIQVPQANSAAPCSTTVPHQSAVSVCHDCLQPSQPGQHLHCIQHSVSGSAPCSTIDRLTDHALHSSWQAVTQQHWLHLGRSGPHPIPHVSAHMTQSHSLSAQVRQFSSTASCRQQAQSSQPSPPLGDQHRTSSNARASFSRRPPPSQSNGKPPSSQPNGKSGSSDNLRPPIQRAPFHRPPSQANSNGGGWSPPSSAQPWGPIHRGASRNPRNPIEPPAAKRLKANREITASEVRLVGTDGQHQVLPLAEALKAAQDAKLDLVQVAGGAIPPVCRLLNHSQVSFEAKVKDRKAEKKQHENRRMAMIKEVHFGAHTAEHDMQVKVKKAKEFLSKGHRVKCTLKHKPVRGQGQKDALKALPSLKERMAEFAEVSAPPATEKQTANTLSFYLAPIIEQNQMRATV